MRFQQMWLRARRWLFDSRGQDLIEYALLSAAIGLAGWAGLNYLTSAMNSTYSSWDTTTQTCEVIELPCPAGDASCGAASCSPGSSGLMSPP